MINEKCTPSGRTIIDLLGEFYDKHQNDRNLIDSLVEAFQIKDGPQSPFLADNAALITSLMNARQKTTSDLLSMLNTIQKLQANELNSDNSGMDDLSHYMNAENEDDPEDDEVEDLLEKIEKNSKGDKKIEEKLIELKTNRA